MLWGAMKLICRAGLESIWSVKFFLRPHHLATDFQSLLEATRRAWEHLASLHTCSLSRTVPAIVVDGKWCLQFSLCNDRHSRSVWEPSLATGYITGCIDRPLRGSKYCSAHQLPLLEEQETQETPELEEHKEVRTAQGVKLQYKVKGSKQWKDVGELPMCSIRNYELTQLPRVGAAGTDETCSKDPRRGTSESFINRKSGGLLVAAYPCLHIVGLSSMYSSESLTQVVLFVWRVLSYLPGIRWVLYDFACGVLRHLRVQAEAREGEHREAWKKLLALRWLVDKLHFCKGHKACKNPQSKFYEPSVNPYVRGLM